MTKRSDETGLGNNLAHIDCVQISSTLINEYFIYNKTVIFSVSYFLESIQQSI